MLLLAVKFFLTVDIAVRRRRQVVQKRYKKSLCESPEVTKINPEFEITHQAFNMSLRERNDSEFYTEGLARTVDQNIQSQLLHQARSMNF